ncbi:hypothetical protein [Methylocaldum sp. 14B]|jgi:hypothetical protein|uniref:hypothetical protein n=1 Tax=Methylocaldum sp. 14B TaxID=1912213 RepID=UPI00117C7A00|nr:hypothetical protein [Methylocaldum sp. 14B]
MSKSLNLEAFCFSDEQRKKLAKAWKREPNAGRDAIKQFIDGTESVLNIVSPALIQTPRKGVHDNWARIGRFAGSLRQGAERLQQAIANLSDEDCARVDPSNRDLFRKLALDECFRDNESIPTWASGDWFSNDSNLLAFLKRVEDTANETISSAEFICAYIKVSRSEKVTTENVDNVLKLLIDLHEECFKEFPSHFRNTPFHNFITELFENILGFDWSPSEGTLRRLIPER